MSTSLARSNHGLSAWLFLRLMALVYFAAFASLWPQITGLIGENGILPTTNFLSNFSGSSLWERFLHAPTLAWINASDFFLKSLCGAGVAFAVILFFDTAPRLVLTFLWILYLSITVIGGDFLSFQWDTLLLETGFLAIFIAPGHLLPTRSMGQPPPSRFVLWLFKWILFRLMFFSGIVKIASGDPSWHNLTALAYHYETQPLPHVLSWYAHQLPLWFHSLSTALVFAIEIPVSFLIFAPLPYRKIAFWSFTLLQILIILTGNYCYFNFLTLALIFLLLDDDSVKKILPGFILRKITPPSHMHVTNSWHHKTVTTFLVLFILLPTSLQVLRFYGITPPLTNKLQSLVKLSSQLRLTGNYGLFAVMTTRRDEIIVEGSDDGEIWKTYEFRYKPGELTRAPALAQPHQPRLDWQMWFASLGTFEENAWFRNFLIRLLQGKKDVTDLLAHNPFPDHPPKFIRSQLYRYWFTSFREQAATGQWWKREFVREYSPIAGLK